MTRAARWTHPTSLAALEGYTFTTAMACTHPFAETPKNSPPGSRLHQQVTLKVGIGVGEYGVEAFGVSEVVRQIRHRASALGVSASDRVDHSEVIAPSRVCSLWTWFHAPTNCSDGALTA